MPETATQKKRRLEKARNKYQQKRLRETAEDKIERLAKRKKTAENETETQRIARLTKKKDFQARARAAETPDEEASRLALDAVRHALARVTQTPDEEASRLALDAERHALARAVENDDERLNRLATNASRNAESRTHNFASRLERLSSKITHKPQKKSVLDRQQPHHNFKEHSNSSADQQIFNQSSTSRKAKTVNEMKVQNMKTNEDDYLYIDPISIAAMSPDRDIKPEILDDHEVEETDHTISTNHNISMEHITTSDNSNTMGDEESTINQHLEEDNNNVCAENINNSHQGKISNHTNYHDDWENYMKRKKLQLELDYLELQNYKIKLELYEMEEKLNLKHSKFTADIESKTVVKH